MMKNRLLCLMLSLMLVFSCFVCTVSAEVEGVYEVTGNFTWNDVIQSEIMTATQENGEYSFTLDQARWQEMNDKAFFEYPYYYCYLDAEGNVVDKETGDANPEGYTKFLCGLGSSFKMPRVNLSLDGMTLFEEESTEPVVISYDYWYDNEHTDGFGRVDGDEYFMSSVFFMDGDTKLENLNITAGCKTQYIKGRTSSADTSKIAVGGSPAANQWNTVKVVLNSDLSKVIGTVVNNVYTECDYALGGATKINKMVLMMGRAWTNTDANGEYLPATYKLKNIKLQRGLPDLVVVGGTENGVVTDRLNVEFSGSISSEIDSSKAFVIYDDIGDKLKESAYSVEWNEDRTTATIILNEYDYDCDFKLVVVPDELKGLFGETVNGGFEVSFVTPFGKSEDEEDDDEITSDSTNLAEGKSFVPGDGIGKNYTTITDEVIDGDRIISFEFDNAAWRQELEANPAMENYLRRGYYQMNIGEEAGDDKYLRIAFDIKTTDPTLDLNSLPALFFQTPGGGSISVTQFNRFDHFYTSALVGQFNNNLDSEWHSLEIIFDTRPLSNGKCAVSLIRYDGETFYSYLTAGTKIQSHSVFNADDPCVLGRFYLETHVSPNCDTSSISFRNPVVEKIDRLAFSVENPDEFVNPEEEIVFEFNLPFPERLSMTDVRIYEKKNGDLFEIPQSFTVAFDDIEKSSFSVKVLDGGLEYGKSYVAEIVKDNVVYGEYNVFEVKTASFATVEKKENIVETIRNISKGEDGTVTLNINIKNNTDTVISGAYMMVACYGENNKMFGVSGKILDDIGIGKSLKNMIVEVSGCEDATEMKIFVFDSNESFNLFHIPVSAGIE